MSDEKRCIYRYADVFASDKVSICGQTVDGINHRDVMGDGRMHDFQPPLEITDEAVEAGARAAFHSDPEQDYPWERRANGTKNDYRRDARAAIEAALRVMQKGKDE